MAEHKGSSKRPQHQHKQSKKSRHDKRVRLKRRNTSRRKTAEAKVPLTGTMQIAVLVLQAVMDRRIAFQLTIIVAGMLLADDRRTASAWLATHPVWGMIALPLRSMLYVHEVNVPKLAEKYDWGFHTKHQLGVELLTWFMKAIRVLGVEAKVWLAVGGAYATRPFLKPTLALGSVVVSRLRKDANLRDLPPQDSHGNRIYGKNKISLAKRAGHREGWSTITSHCRGVEGTRQYKTFLATSRLISGEIRVVIVRFEDGGWATYFCTDTSVEVCDVLETVAARWAIEEHFHDVNEVWGAGQQQVRNV